MKKMNFYLFTLLVSVSLIFMSCEKDDNLPAEDDSILPESFMVDIPEALSMDLQLKAVTVDTLKGNQIYMHLNTFIRVGEHAAEIVQEIIKTIRLHHIIHPMIFSFISEEDGRVKNVEVIAGANFDGESWEFQMTITDAESEGNEDGGKALQIFWNRNPVKGIAILKPYNINRNEENMHMHAMFRIDYSEGGEYNYEKHMIVSIADLTLPIPSEEPWAMGTLKMFAGKKGNHVDVYGNSDHPNASFHDVTETGFNWAFVASANDNEDIGVAEVGLPPSNLDEPGRSTLLAYYSIKNVFTRQILKIWPNIDQEILNAYLFNTQAPGYFDHNGFIQGGTSPGQAYDELVLRIQNLSPYNPKEIHNLSISFE